MIAPYATLRVSLNGGAPQTGGVTALQADTVQLSADPAGLAGATSVRFEIYDYPPSFGAPSGWSTDSDGIYYYQGTTPPSFACGTWGKFMLRLKLNNGLSEVASIPASQLVTEATAINILSPSGLYAWSSGETDQFEKSWAEHQKLNQQTIETVLGATGASKSLLPAKAAATSNVASKSGTTTLDGISCGVGDRVFLPFQTAAAENGPWVVASGAWERPTDFDNSADVLSGQTIIVTQGATYGGTQWALVSSGPFTLGTTALTWSQVGGGAGSSAGTIQPVDIVLTSNDSLSGLSARDGVTPTAGTRVLATAQSTASQNGVYVAASGAWTRAADCDADGDLILGQQIYAKPGGTLGGDTRWYLQSGTTIAGSKTYSRVVPGAALQDPRGITLTPRALARMIGIDVDDDTVNGRSLVDTGRITLKNYGASPYWVGNSTTHTSTAGSGAVTLAAIAKFKNGNWILLHQAGVAHGLATPAAPTLVVQGATGASTVSVKVVALTAHWGYTAASTATTITNAPASYSATNYVEVFCADVPGAYKYLIYAQFGGSGGTYNLIGAIIAHPQYNEHGQVYPLTFKINFAAKATTKTPTLGLPATAPAAAVPNAWRAKITAGGGTTSITVSPAPRSSVAGGAVEICNLIPMQDCLRHGGNTCIGGEVFVPPHDYTDGYRVTGDLYIDRPVLLRGGNDATGQSVSSLIFKDGCQVGYFNTTGAEAWSPRRQTRIGDRVTKITRTGNLRTYECTAVSSTDGTWGVTGSTEPAWDDSGPSVVQPTDGEITWRAWGFTGGLSSSAQHSSIRGLRLYWPEHVIPCGRYFIDNDYRESASERTLRTDTPNWLALTAYGAGVYRLPTQANATGKIYVSSGGTSGATEPTWPTTIGGTVVDGSITWTCVDQTFVQGAMVLISTQMKVKSLAIDGGRGCGVVWDGCSHQTGGATNKSYSEDIIIDRIYGGHAWVSQGSDGSACVHSTPKIGVPGDVLTGNVDHGSCGILDTSFYGNVYFGVLCDGGWRAQNRKVVSTQCIGLLLACYFEGTVGADADWNKPSQIRGGLLAGGIRSGCVPLVSDFVLAADLTSPFDSWKSLYDWASGVSQYMNSGVLYTTTDPNTTSYDARTRGGEYRTFNNGCWDHGVVTDAGNTVTQRRDLYSHRGVGPSFLQGLFAGDRIGRIQAITAYPTLGTFLPGDLLLWYAEGAAFGPPRMGLVAKRRGVIGATARANSTAYIRGQIYTSSSRAFVVVRGGTSASSAPAGLAAATLNAFVTDGTCVVQCYNTTTNDPLLQSIPITGERVALADADNTFGITNGTHYLFPDPAAERTYQFNRTSAIPGDQALFVWNATTAHSVTLKDSVSAATLLTVPAASGFGSCTIRLNDAGAWERIR